MNDKRFFPPAVKLFFLILLAGWCSPAVYGQPAIQMGYHSDNLAKSAKPNIIFILVDDMGWGDLGALYQNKRKNKNDPAVPWAATPMLDTMARQGALLTNHYAAAPVCAPSRASLLSGLSQGHANVRDNQFDKALADNHTLATVLKEAGYATAAIGKWGLQGDTRYSKNGDQWLARPRNRGFDYFLGYMRHVDGHEHYPKEGLYIKPMEVWQNDANIAAKLDKSYTADLWTAAAKQWITKHEQEGDAGQPFFMYLAYDTPHAVLELPTQAYPEGGGLNGGMQWLGKPGHMISTASGKPDSWMHPDYADATYDDDQNPSTPQAPWPDVYKRYATDIRRIDSGVGDIMQLLKDLNIDDNTLIVFSSDNGPSKESYLNNNKRKVNRNKTFHPNAPYFFRSYGPFDGIKRDTWEGGLREPTIAWWKGHIAEGQVIDRPSSQYDWLPTFTDAVGLPAPANADGVSLLPSLTGKGAQQEGLVYAEYYHKGSTPEYEDFAPKRRGTRRKQMQMIRMGDYAGVRYNIHSADDDFEIYNVVKDPGQRNNLAENPEKPPLVQKLEKKMKEKVLQVRMPNSSAERPYDKALIPASEDVKATQGVLWKAYDGPFPWVPQVTALTPTAAGQAPRPAVSVHAGDNQAQYFTGYIEVPKDGTYTFYLTADTGALLRIHDATVIDADYGYKGGSEKSGSVRLKSGKHAFRLYYMRKAAAKPQLKFEWEGPAMNKQPIPAAAFSYAEKK